MIINVEDRNRLYTEISFGFMSVKKT